MPDPVSAASVRYVPCNKTTFRPAELAKIHEESQRRSFRAFDDNILAFTLRRRSDIRFKKIVVLEQPRLIGVHEIGGWDRDCGLGIVAQFWSRV